MFYCFERERKGINKSVLWTRLPDLCYFRTFGSNFVIGGLVAVGPIHV